MTEVGGMGSAIHRSVGIYMSKGRGGCEQRMEIHSLKTSTPEEGFALAVQLSQKGVVVTQPSAEIRQRLRSIYSMNADSLIAVSQVIAINFQTVAAANNYWT